MPQLNRSQQVRSYPYQSMMKGMEEQTSARSSRRKRNKCGPVLSEWLTITRAVSEGKSGASGGRSLKSWAELKGAWAWASQRCGNKVKHGLITVRNRTSFSRGFWCCLRHGAQVLTSKCWLFYLWDLGEAWSRVSGCIPNSWAKFHPNRTSTFCYCFSLAICPQPFASVQFLTCRRWYIKIQFAGNREDCSKLRS